MMHTTALIEAMGERTAAEIAAIDAEIERQIEFQRIDLDYLDKLRANRKAEGEYTIERLRYRRLLLVGEAPAKSEPTPESETAKILGIKEAA